MPPTLIAEVEAWAMANETTRSDAFRRLVELGLDSAKTGGPVSAKRAVEAKHLASEALDQMADKSATADEQASRKRKLIGGPEEFQAVRIDRAKAKPKG
jgi:hypothetical protein